MSARACIECGAITEGPYCSQHKRDHRSPSSRRTSSRAFQRLRPHVFHVYGYSCHWCARPLTLKSAQVDHLVPVSQGGTDEITNLRPSCAECNNRRGNRGGTSR